MESNDTNIYKYSLEYKPKQSIRADVKKILDIQIQNGKPCLWALVKGGKDTVKFTTIYCFGTGTMDVGLCCNENLKHIATTQVNGYVFHWFYE